MHYITLREHAMMRLSSVVVVAALLALTKMGSVSGADDEICPNFVPGIDFCLTVYTADSGAACKECLEGADDQLTVVGGDTCATLSTRVCTYLENCPCPTSQCRLQFQLYYGCYKEEVTDRTLGCDAQLDCCFNGGCVLPPIDLLPPTTPVPTRAPTAPPPFSPLDCRSGNILCLIYNVFATFISFITTIFTGP